VYADKRAKDAAKVLGKTARRVPRTLPAGHFQDNCSGEILDERLLDA
jgi:hypothetical protein